jgi:beta-N-acetylhexosaminidase
VLTGLLRETLGFQGLIVTDDLEMGALQSVGQAEAGFRALQAGADFLLFRFDESAQLAGHRRIVDAVRAGTLGAARLDASVRRIVELKRTYGIHLGRRPAPSIDLTANARAALDLARGGTTLLRNRGALPLRGRLLAIAPANPDLSVLPDQPWLGSVLARKRADAMLQTMPMRPASSDVDRAVTAARQADGVVIGTTNLFAYPEQAQLVLAVAKEKPVTVVALRGPYDLMSVPDVSAYLCAYDGREPSLIAAVEVMLGERKPVGTLPVDIPGLFRIGAGMKDLA